MELKKEHNSGVASLAEKKKWNKIEAQGPRLSHLSKTAIAYRIYFQVLGHLIYLLYLS